jgi:hypothetical protein
MGVFDWVSSLVGLAATKLVETIASETTKKWLDEGKLTKAKTTLVDLYELIVVLEYSSSKFVERLEEFNEFSLLRIADNQKLSDDPRWYMGWGKLLAGQANEVAEQMRPISTMIQKLNPRIEIYLPEVVEYMKKYEVFARSELSIAEMVIAQELSDTTAGELRAITPKIREAVEKLVEQKRALADFIKSQFPFKEM